MIKSNSNRKYLILLLLLYFAIVYILFNILGITCIFLEILGFPCPGCGMTRAALSLMRFDIVSATKYNITVFFMPYVFAYMFFNLKNKVHNYIMTGIAFVAISNWILKLIMFF